MTLDKKLAQMVLEEKKPCALVGIGSVLQQDFDVLICRSPNKMTQWAISLPNKKTSDYILEEDLARYQKTDETIYQRTVEMYKIIKDKSVVESMRTICEVPFKDDDFKAVEKNGIERPEVAILKGLLLGYKPCCVEYYIQRNYLEQPRHKLEKTKDKSNPHFLCYSCAKSRLKT